MQVNETLATQGGGRIEFGLVAHGGHSSWSDQEDSIRLAWSTRGGGFDPISSSEVPVWGLVELACAAADRDVFDTVQLAWLVERLGASLHRQNP